MIDHTAARENQQILHAFIAQEDSEISAGVGLEALRFLALQMTTEKFREFLQNAIDDVSSAKKAFAQQLPQKAAAPNGAPNPTT